MSAAPFDYPLFLLGLAAFVPLLLADRLSGRAGRIAGRMPARLRGRFFGSTALFRLSTALLIVALAGPRWGDARAPGDFRRAVDVVFAIDVSRSMEVPDGLGEYLGPGGGPTRLDRGLDVAREVVAALPGARFAVAVSRGRGVVAVPLTWDGGAATNFLDALGGSAMTGRGTNLEALLDAAATAFRPSPPSRRAIVMISDGEELSGSLRAAVERLGREGVPVAALAVGSAGGGTFPGGGAVVSRRDSAAMRMAAAGTGGVYVDGGRPDAAATLAAFLGDGAGVFAAGGSGGAGEREPRWLPFAVAALLAFGASRLCLLGGRGKGDET